MTSKPVVTRSILLAAMAAGACFGTGTAFAADTACISAHNGSHIFSMGENIIDPDNPHNLCAIDTSAEIHLDIEGNHLATTVGADLKTHPTFVDAVTLAANIPVHFANGFAGAEAVDTHVGFTTFTITAAADHQFDDVIFHSQLVAIAPEELRVQAFLDGAQVGNTVFTGLPHNANNEFQVFDTGGMTEVMLTALDGSAIKEVKQIEISGFGPTVTPVPEPSTFALMVLGVVGVGLATSRRTGRSRRGGAMA